MVTRLFDGAELSTGGDSEKFDREDPPGHLWDPEAEVEGGVNHGGNDT